MISDKAGEPADCREPVISCGVPGSLESSSVVQLVREAQVERLVCDEASEQEVGVVVEGVVRLVLAQPEQHLLAHVDV